MKQLNFKKILFIIKKYFFYFKKCFYIIKENFNLKIKVSPLIFLFSVIGGIIIYNIMDTWGSMPKNQIDDQLISEAITEAIIAHEADPTAHLGDGESLEQHKSNEIIDHPAQSVVSDKVPFELYDEISTVIGGYDWEPDTGSISVNGTRNLYFSLYSQSNVETLTELPFNDDFPYPEKDLLFNFKLLLNGAQNSNGSSYLTFSENGLYNDTTRIEFIKTGTNYYFRIYLSNILVKEYLLQAGGQFQKFIGLYFDSTNEKIILSVNGLDVAEYETVNWHNFIFNKIGAKGTRTTNTSIELGITNWKARYNLF